MSRFAIQTDDMVQRGVIFVLDMGDSVKIVDLAKCMIMLSGLCVDQDTKIFYTGLLPGEKMYEELLMNEESAFDDCR